MDLKYACQKTRMYLMNIGNKADNAFSKANDISLKLMASAGILAYCAEAYANPAINNAEQRDTSELDVIISGSCLGLFLGSYDFFETEKRRICGTVLGGIGLLYAVLN